MLLNRLIWPWYRNRWALEEMSRVLDLSVSAVSCMYRTEFDHIAAMAGRQPAAAGTAGTAGAGSIAATGLSVPLQDRAFCSAQQLQGDKTQGGKQQGHFKQQRESEGNISSSGGDAVINIPSSSPAPVAGAAPFSASSNGVGIHQHSPAGPASMLPSPATSTAAHAHSPRPTTAARSTQSGPSTGVAAASTAPQAAGRSIGGKPCAAGAAAVMATASTATPVAGPNSKPGVMPDPAVLQRQLLGIMMPVQVSIARDTWIAWKKGALAVSPVSQEDGADSRLFAEKVHWLVSMKFISQEGHLHVSDTFI